MSIATVLFFMWGFLTCLNDILIPHLKGIFNLNYGQALLVQFAFFSSYAIFALPSGKLIDWRGYKQSMVIGLVVMAAGALLFLPAASTASFPLFLSALVILAAGITCLQVSANPYVTNLGPQATAGSRLNLAQAFNSLGTTVAPFFGGALILGAAQATPDRIKSFSAAMLQGLSCPASLHCPPALPRHRPHAPRPCRRHRHPQAPHRRLHPRLPPR